MFVLQPAVRFSPQPLAPPTLTPPSEMILLREYCTESELLTALQATRVFPDLLFTHYAIKNFLNKTYPCNQLRVFSYPHEDPMYWFVVDCKKADWPVIHIAQQGSRHDRAVYTAAVRCFLDEIHAIIADSSFYLCTESHLQQEVERVFPAMYANHTTVSKDATNIFYMDGMQVENLQALSLTVPYGYRFDELSVDHDLPTVHSALTRPQSEQETRDRLRHLPSLCVRHSSSEETVSWEMSTQFGNLTHQFTHSDHRRKGLGRAVELKLAQKVASCGNVPFKMVEVCHTALIRSSEDSPFWTTWHRDECPVKFIVQRIEKN